MKNNILCVVLAALALFVWGFISWAVLPWHNMAANQFLNEPAVAQVLKQNAAVAGVYYLPFAKEDHKSGEAAAFVNVLPDGFDMNMGKLMGMAFLGHMLSVLLVLKLLSCTSGLNYWRKVGFVGMLGLLIGFASHFPYWNWFGFPASYVCVMVFDTLIAWVLAGLVMARFVACKKSLPTME